MKHYLTITLGLLMSAFFSIAVSGQITKGGTPFGKANQDLLASVPSVQLGAVDVRKLLEEDQERRKLGKEFDRRFGQTFEVAWGLDNSGSWVSLPNGGRIWRLRISSPGALSINLTFSKYKLPAGGRLFLWGGKNQIGALTDFNNQADEKLGTGLILGDEVFLEYFEPKEVTGQGKIQVGYATHGYKSPYSVLGWGDSDDCEMNVNCPMGQAWQIEKRSIARIIDNGDVCTGAMINNVLQDGKPYFLSANHCYSASSTTWVFSFNWESPTCTTPTTPIAEDQTISGSILRARNAASDFLLLELSSKPPADFGVFYCGWSAEDVPSQSSTIIHHPAGDIKKITFDTDPARHSGYGVNAPNDSSHWRTMAYEFATTTEGGSSGSPLFDQNHRIVGQLHGGPASCTNINSDFYGKVSTSWTGGGTPATRLKDWLDPTGTNVFVLNGFDTQCNRLNVRLPWVPNLDTVAQNLPYRWKVKNPDGDSTFRLVTGGFLSSSGKAFRLSTSAVSPSLLTDSLLSSPLDLLRYKKLKVRFRHAYRTDVVSPLGNEKIRVLVSKDCGLSFQPVATLSGTTLVTDPAQGLTTPFFPADTNLWKSNTIVLDSTFDRSSSLQVALEYNGASKSTLWIDAFEVTGDTAREKPVALFEPSAIQSCAGIPIGFNDQSLNGPTQWNWTFEGGNPSTSTSQNPVVTYSAEGSYLVRLIVSNSEGRDTLERENLIQIQDLGSVQTPFYQNFSTPGFPPSGYVLLNPDNNVTWERSTLANAPNSAGASMMFNNYSNPNVTGQKDRIVFPKFSTAGKAHLKLRFKYAYKFYPSFGGGAPDSLTIGFTQGCTGAFKPLWKKGGTSLATAGSTTSIYTPVAGDWQTLVLNLDSLLSYSELAIGFENRFGFGNRIFLDDIYIDTVDACPPAPVAQSSADTLCSGSTLILTMDSVSNAGYAWTGPGNFSATSRIATRLVSVNSAGIYLGSLTQYGCKGPSDTLRLVVNPAPNVPNFSQSGNVLTATGTFAGYMWLLGSDTLENQTASTLTATESGMYTLVVFNAFGCSRSSLPKNVVVTGNNSRQEMNQVQLIPNPTEGRLRVVSGNNLLKQVVIFNAMGAEVMRLNTTNSSETVELDLTGLAPGNYWALLQSEQKTITLPLLKK
jgi:PKD repeat protein